jgi:multidrug resistance protein MdtO
VKTGLLQQRSLAVVEGEEVLIQEVEERASSVLHGLANAIESEVPEQLSSWSTCIEEVCAKVSIEEDKSRDGKDLQKHTEMRLSASLLDVASNLVRRAQSNFTLEAGTAKAGGNSSVVGEIAETQRTAPCAD